MDVLSNAEMIACEKAAFDSGITAAALMGRMPFGDRPFGDGPGFDPIKQRLSVITAIEDMKTTSPQQVSRVRGIAYLCLIDLVCPPKLGLSRMIPIKHILCGAKAI